jgi:hypothetical protein
VGESAKSGQRRSGRIPRRLPIQVTGIDASGRDFTTPAHTLVLSRYGAEILLKTELVPDQEISVGLLGHAKDWDARIVGLFSRRPQGFSYGIEFLSQDGNFWGINFPAPPQPAKAQNGFTSPPPGLLKPAPLPVEKLSSELRWKEPPNAAPAKTYAIRLRCVHHESPNGVSGRLRGDEDQWLIVEGRTETLQQVLETAWDFTCPIHGTQREYPLEAQATDPGFRIRFDVDLLGIDPPGPFRQGKAAPKPRREPRYQKKMRVWVRGIDSNGNAFRQSAQSLDISRSGARLEGLGMLTLPGTTIEVRRQWRKALFRIIWTGKRGSAEASQVGIVCLEPSRNIWSLPEDN